MGKAVQCTGSFLSRSCLLLQPASTALAGAMLWWKVTTLCVSSAAVLTVWKCAWSAPLFLRLDLCGKVTVLPCHGFEIKCWQGGRDRKQSVACCWEWAEGGFGPCHRKCLWSFQFTCFVCRGLGGCGCQSGRGCSIKGCANSVAQLQKLTAIDVTWKKQLKGSTEMVRGH